MKKFWIVFILGLFFCSCTFAQHIFQKHYGTQIGSDYVRKIIPTSDGGYASTGYTTSFGKGDKDMYLAKFSFEGNMMWSMTYGAEGHDEGISLIENSDGGYLIVGYTWTNTFGENDIYVVKTNANGQMMWNKTFGGSLKELAWDVVELSNQKYLLLCQTQSYSHGLMDICLMKITSTGGFEWAKSYGGVQNEWCYNMRKTNDGKYLLAGATFTYGSGKHDMLLMKVDENGIIDFCTIVGGASEDYAYCANQDGLGNYLIGGKTSSPANNQENIFVKLDNNANLVWQKYFGGNGEEVIMNILTTVENGYFVNGWTYSYSAGERDVFLSNFSTDGKLNWLKAYGGGEDEVVPTKSSFIVNEKIVIGANTKSFSSSTFRATEWDGYLIKADYSGNSGCYESDYYPSESNANLSISDITTTIGVMSASFKTSILGDDLEAGLESYSLCFTGISENEKTENRIVLNNPFTNFLKIQLDESFDNSATIIIRDILGKEVFVKNYSSSINSFHIQTETWENGVYIVELHTDQLVNSIKVLKQ
ncbi:MAG: T9SS type A sorting domain-containing protein [Bacteroidetes bacterium]|nr:T9SS type A sorting domain-containing protein [Bacteroidota bacterium]MBT3421684.1 T9SS type A sorting domain-containing protein [Bacteroidota bacterium]MBT3801829.1 T9SS type A sorting domain-containing protein [Bacteroidota bacterium]MBT4729321.1 T9SS type A sorting domain-containing protein [Bacteroidota bacterium]MBT6836754.1 T9SS type A sorting domain-containing protein [Bacteroidota bacterium]